MQKIPIWGNIIPGNSAKRKEEVMELGDPRFRNATIDTIRWILTLKKQHFSSRAKKIVDTYTHTWVRKEDPEYHDTFEDVPHLIPFIAEGSDKAIIVVPGGGYCAKSMEGEGTQVAEKLCASGITAFVLWYRCNPYYMPYPLMDLQRAVRWVRFHAKTYGYDTNKIGAIGFSAGGAQVSLFANVLRQGLIQLPQYQKDEIDGEDDKLNLIGLGYPALSYHYNRSMLFASFPAQQVRNVLCREKFVETYDALKHMSTQGIPHYLTWGTKDTMVSLKEIHAYVEKLEQSNTRYMKCVLAGAGHGYGASREDWLNEYISWLKQL